MKPYRLVSLLIIQNGFLESFGSFNAFRDQFVELAGLLKIRRHLRRRSVHIVMLDQVFLVLLEEVLARINFQFVLDRRLSLEVLVDFMSTAGLRLTIARIQNVDSPSEMTVSEALVVDRVRSVLAVETFEMNFELIRKIYRLHLLRRPSDDPRLALVAFQSQSCEHKLRLLPPT